MPKMMPHVVEKGPLKLVPECGRMAGEFRYFFVDGSGREHDLAPYGNRIPSHLLARELDVGTMVKER